MFPEFSGVGEHQVLRKLRGGSRGRERCAPACWLGGELSGWSSAAVREATVKCCRVAVAMPFADGLHLAFTFAAVATAIAIVASAVRGQRYLHATEPAADELANGAAELGGLAGLDPVDPADVDVTVYESLTTAAEQARPGGEQASRPPRTE